MKINKPKILIMAKLPPPINGATLMSEKVVSSKLLKKKFNLNTIRVSFSKQIKELGVFSFIKVFKSILYLFELTQKLIIFRPQLVYFTISKSGIPFFRDLVYVTIIKIFGPKIIFHSHGRGIKEIVNRNKLIKSLYKFVFNKEEVIVLSKNLISDVEDVHYKNPFVVMYGIKDYFDNFEPRSLIQNEKPKILFLSNIAIEKGAYDFIDALFIVKNDGYDFTANVIGSPGTNTSAEQFNQYINSKKLNDVVKYKGPKYDNEKYKEYHKSDIFVFPTHFESFGIVALEAMQFELPVIASNEGSLPIIIENGSTGLLAETKNAVDFADKIKKLISDRDSCLKMGKNGRGRFKEYFTDDVYEKNILKVFNKCLINLELNKK